MPPKPTRPSRKQRRITIVAGRGKMPEGVTRLPEAMDPAGRQKRVGLTAFGGNASEAEDHLSAIQSEWERWGRKASVEDRIIISSWAPSLKRGDPREIEEMANLLLDFQKKEKSVTKPTLRHLTAVLLRACLQAKISAPQALMELAARLLEVAKPKYQRAKPDARRKAIAYIVDHPTAGHRKIAEAAGVSRSLIQKWINDDPHFADEVNERAKQKIL